MARRNKKRTRREGFVFPVPFVGIFVLLVSLGLVYVWLDCQCDAFGRAIKSLETEGQDLQRKAGLAQYRWARLKSPRSLDASLARHNMSMGTPQWNQIVKLDQAASSESHVAQAPAYVPAYAHARGAGQDE
jgi:hypothetical protein